LIFFSFNIRIEIEEKEEEEEEEEEEKEKEKNKLPLMVFNNIPCSGVLYCQLPFSALSIPPVPNGLHTYVIV
jgi:hypothetical protein